ncbi:hypothetical protein A4X13_0g5515 [Tilletia indica]|uniref:Transcription factor CBF/NF-Y/archaeal histone domain-containing protein n=1 Tax=Tilletia indica TaxID=43049 RepID=A0A177TWZ1_9BASI|nr:hypothetical protein A4X13_0g5515 [Tilletia indica]
MHSPEEEHDLAPPQPTRTVKPSKKDSLGAVAASAPTSADTSTSPGKQKGKAAAGAAPRKPKGAAAGTGSKSTPASRSASTSLPAASTDPPAASGTSVFPTARVQRIIKSDEDLTNCSAEAAFLIAIATECFIKYFVEESYASARMEKRKAISYKDCQRAVQREWALGFLQEAVPPTMPLSLALKKAGALEASALRGIALSNNNAAGAAPGGTNPSNGAGTHEEQANGSEHSFYDDADYPEPSSSSRRTKEKPVARSSSGNGKQKSTPAAAMQEDEEMYSDGQEDDEEEDDGEDLPYPVLPQRTQPAPSRAEEEDRRAADWSRRMMEERREEETFSDADDDF